MEPAQTMIERIQKSVLALFMILMLFSALCLLEMLQVVPLLMTSIICVLLITKKDPKAVLAVMGLLLVGEACTITWLCLDLKRDSLQKSIFLFLTMVIVIIYELFLIHYYKVMNARKTRHEKVMVLV